MQAFSAMKLSCSGTRLKDALSSKNSSRNENLIFKSHNPKKTRRRTDLHYQNTPFTGNVSGYINLQMQEACYLLDSTDLYRNTQFFVQIMIQAIKARGSYASVFRFAILSIKGKIKFYVKE